MEYDPTQFVGTARYYLRGRPPYSAELTDVLSSELGLDGSGRLLDVGSGPGTLGVQLAPMFEHVTLLEPDADMLAEARAHAANEGLTAVAFLRATAEDIPRLEMPPMRAVTFGQSFHRTDRVRVAEAVYDVLEPGGALVSVVHDPSHPAPSQPRDTPPVPHGDILDLIRTYLGSELHSGARPVSSYRDERFEETLARTRFGRPRITHAPGRTDIIRDVDSVIAGYLSMSYASPKLLGPRADDFIDDLRALLEESASDGTFWDWPGDTEILIATRPRLTA